MEDEEEPVCLESNVSSSTQMSAGSSRVEGFASIVGVGSRRARRLTRRSRPSPQPPPHPPLTHSLLPAVVTEGTPDNIHNTFPRQVLN